ncbi:VanZ family protein [Paludibaculum fermentans]|uniref:VanZ family protein n=1 Tax=Paludibaculum fermentans TaxID=1473598 RepID=UPI003EB78397
MPSGWRIPVTPLELWLAAMLRRPAFATALCIAILVGFAIAGLWPFRPIHNDIAWLPDGPGIQFGRHGVLVGSAALPAYESGSCSIELWVRPTGGEEVATLLSFYDSGRGRDLALYRSISDLRLDRETAGGRPDQAYVNDVFSDGKPVFLTVVTSARGTAVYLDGVLARKLSSPRAIRGDCSGRLAVGQPAKGHTNWQGDIRGLAIYRRELAPEAVLMSFQAWRSGGRPGKIDGGKPDILYLFDEKRGSTVRDHGALGVNLNIPDTYRTIHRTWLESPHTAFEIHYGYFEDIVINIAGFAPFGFALSALLAAFGQVRRVWAWAVAGGFLVSMTIELLQGYLPTRNSDLTDVLTNTLGTCIGATIYMIWMKRIEGGRQQAGFSRL